MLLPLLRCPGWVQTTSPLTAPEVPPIEAAHPSFSKNIVRLPNRLTTLYNSLSLTTLQVQPGNLCGTQRNGHRR